MKKILTIIFFTISFTGFSQYEAAHWFFGEHSGVDFSSGTPVPEPVSMINTEEGCSSISNACGDLVLYTDGITVWNANHQVMLNGTGLKGDDSSTQSGIVIPKPNDDFTYYIFTVDDAFISPSDDGLCYSKVDMTLDGGLGGVVSSEKNITLVNKSSEKVTAVASQDGSYVWVITFAPNTNSTTAPYQVYQGVSIYNTFYAFKVTQTGVNPTAVLSTLSINVDSGAGYMKVSPDGTKLAIANMNSNSAYVMDFNIVTGEVSNPQLLQNNFGAFDPYGLEFSPDSSKLYISDRNDRLVQYDLNNNNSPLLISTHQNYRSALQLGIDGKIYQTHTLGYGNGTRQLSYIENPNELGIACNYNYAAITLPTNMEVRQGLPPFIQSYFTQISSLNVTANVVNTFEIYSNSEITSADWDFGDGNTTTTYPDNPPDNTHTQVNYLYDTPGTYTITVVLHLASGCDVTVQDTIIIPPPIDDQFFCFDTTTGQGEVVFHDFDNLVIATQPTSGNFLVTYYTSRDDAINQANEITDPYTTSSSSEEIFYVVENLDSGVKYLGKFNIIASLIPEIQNVTSLEYCDSDDDGIAEFDLTQKINEILGPQTNLSYDVKFYPTQTDAEADTNEITNTTNYINTNPFNETIWYSIINTESGCSSQSSLDLIVHPLIEINMEDEYIICEGATLQIDAPSGFSQYDWSTGDNTQSITINAAGQYTLTVTDTNGCSNSKNITVIPSNTATIERVEITDFQIANSNSFEVTVTGLGEYEYSMDGVNYQESNIFNNLYPGTYTVYVSDKNGCGVTEQIVDILGAPQFFTPNEDGYNDFWQIINVTKRPGTVVHIYDRYGKLMATINSAGPGWDGMYNGKPAIATDYWYVVDVKELDGNIRKVKGHFTLKR